MASYMRRHSVMKTPTYNIEHLHENTYIYISKAIIINITYKSMSLQYHTRTYSRFKSGNWLLVKSSIADTSMVQC